MKKFSLLLLMLIVGIGSTWAATEVTTDNISTAMVDGVYITLQCMDTNGGDGYYFNGATTKSSTLGYANFYKIVANSDASAFYLQRVSDSKYVANSSNAVAMVDATTDAAAFTFSIATATGWTTTGTAANNGTNSVRFTTSSTFLNCQNAAGTPKFATGTGGYSIWQVKTYEESEVTPYSLTGNFSIKNYRSSSYATWTGDATQISQNSKLTLQGVWTITYDGTAYKLGNKGTSNYFATVSSFTSDGAQVYIKENTYNTGYYCISLTSDLSANCWDDQSGLVGNWYPSSSDYAGTSWTLAAVSDETLEELIEADAKDWAVSLPTDKPNIAVGEKANFITAATAADDNDHWFLMTQTRDGESPMYDVASGSTVKRAASTVTPSSLDGATAADNKAYLVRFCASEVSGAYNLQFATGNYISTTLTTGKLSAAGSYLVYNIASSDTHIGWNLTTDGTTYGSRVDNNGAGNTLSLWGSGQITSTGGNNDWCVYPVTFEEAPETATVTYNFVLSGSTDVLYTQTTEANIGEAYPTPALPSTTHAGSDYYTLSGTPEGTVTSEGATATITVTQNLPFTVSTSTDDATWYTMTIGNSKKYIYYEADATSMPLSRTTTTYADADLFCFMGNVVSGFTIYNKAAGTDYVLAGPSDPYQGTTGSTAYVFMQAKTTESTCKAWDIQKSSNIDGGFYIAEHGLANNVRMNDRGSLAFWTSGADAGSTFIVTEVSNDATINYTLTDDLGTEYAGSCTGAFVGGSATFSFASAAGATITQTSCTKGSTGYDYVGTIKFPFSISNSTTQNAVTIESALGSSKWCNDGSGNAIATNSDNTYIYSTNKDNYSWYIYPTFSEGVFSFKLYNVGADKWMPTADNVSTSYGTATAMVADKASAGAFPFMTINTGNGFATNTTDNKFLTINTSAASQNIWEWSYSSGSGHKGSNLSFADLTYKSDADVTTEFNALKNTTKFELIDDATVVSPSEYAAPSAINAAIDAAKDVDDTDVNAMVTFIRSDNGKKIATFNSASASYGAPLTTNYTIKASRYGTIILPVNWSIPSNWTVYTCSAIEGTTLTLTQASSATKNTPYIVLTSNTADETFQFIGYSNGAGTADVKSGLLTGSLTEGGTAIPEGSYVLATNTSTGKQAFYCTDGTVTCAKNKCYLTKESSSAREAVIYFPGDDTPTAIESIFGGESKAATNGKYIQNGKFVIVNNGLKFNVAGQKIVNE